MEASKHGNPGLHPSLQYGTPQETPPQIETVCGAIARLAGILPDPLVYAHWA